MQIAMEHKIAAMTFLSLPATRASGEEEEGVAPTIMGYQRQTMRIQQDERTALECKAFGNPRPDLQWTRDSKDLNSTVVETNSSSKVYGKFGMKATLAIATRLEDSGIYVCQATNSYGMDNSTFEVKVVTDPLIKFGHPENLALVVGESAKLTCPLRNESVQLDYIEWLFGPTPHLEDKALLQAWICHGGLCVPFPQGRHFEPFGLRLEEVTAADEGFYTCRVAITEDDGSHGLPGHATSYVKVLPGKVKVLSGGDRALLTSLLPLALAGIFCL